MNTQNGTLEILLSRINQRDNYAMTELYARTKPKLHEYVRRIIRDVSNTEEVLQDTYQYIWLHTTLYQPTKGTPAVWLYTIARSRALDALRSRREDTRLESFDDSYGRTIASDPEQDFISTWQAARVRTCVRSLSSNYQEMIRLVYFEGYSHVEIARKTGLPLGTVKGRIRAAIAALRKSWMPAPCEWLSRHS